MRFWDGRGVRERRCFDVVELEMRYCFVVDGFEGASGFGASEFELDFPLVGEER